MICPVCKTNNAQNHGDEFCVQCASDLHVHSLLCELREEIQMKYDTTKHEEVLSKKTSRLFIVSQIVPAILLLVCAVFGIFVGIRFLTFLDRMESNRSFISNKWSETGFEQLQQMNSTIKQELDLILDQRRENQALQAKIQELTTKFSKNSAGITTPYPTVLLDGQRGEQ